MSDKAPENFGSAWFKHFNESRPLAVMSLLYAALTLIGTWYLWSIAPQRTPREVFWWVFAGALSLLVLFGWHAMAAWNTEHEKRLSAEGLKQIAEQALSRKKNGLAIAKDLNEHLLDGNMVAAYQLAVDEDFTEFRKSCHEWVEKLGKKMSALGCPAHEISFVISPTYIDIQSAPPFHEYSKPIWNEKKKLHLVRVSRLSELIQRYGSG